jgi:integrase
VWYRARIRLRGHPPADASFKRKTDAERWAVETEAKIREGRWFQHIEARRNTFADLIDRYLKEYLPTAGLRSEAMRRAHLAWWRAELGATMLADLTPALIVKARSKLLATTVERTKSKLTPSTANRYLASLSHCLNIGVSEFQLLDDSPLRKVKPQREPRGRVRFLSADERTALLSECKAHSETLHLVVLCALSTGARQGELLGLRWNDVDIVRGMLTFHETKNGERRTVPLTGPALIAMSDREAIRPPGDNPRVFRGRVKHDKPMSVDAIFRRAVGRAGIKDFRFHDLRHSAASELAMSGATLAEIAETLGHKSFDMVKRYSHLTKAHTHDVVSRMTAKVFG